MHKVKTKISRTPVKDYRNDHLTNQICILLKVILLKNYTAEKIVLLKIKLLDKIIRLKIILLKIIYCQKSYTAQSYTYEKDYTAEEQKIIC